MAVIHSKTLFDRFQIDTTGLTFLPIRSYLLRPSTAFRFEFRIEGFDGVQASTFNRVLSIKRGLSGAPSFIGPAVWHTSQTTKSSVAFDLRVILNLDGSFTIEAKNATATTTTWKGVVERIAISR
jgi:hypothetical protein